MCSQHNFYKKIKIKLLALFLHILSTTQPLESITASQYVIPITSSHYPFPLLLPITPSHYSFLFLLLTPYLAHLTNFVGLFHLVGYLRTLSYQAMTDCVINKTKLSYRNVILTEQYLIHNEDIFFFHSIMSLLKLNTTQYTPSTTEPSREI